MEVRKWMAGGLAMALLTVGLSLGACQAPTSAQMQQVHEAYRKGDYTTTFQKAALLAQTSSPGASAEPAYMAGLAAYQLGKHEEAQRYLKQAVQRGDRRIMGDALAQLGVLHSDRRDYDAAASALLEASHYLQGEDKARACFYGAVALQNLGRWPQARTNLLLARNLTSDSALRERIEKQLAIVGFTVQVGAYSRESSARAVAHVLADKAAAFNLGAPWVLPARYPDGRTLYLVQVGKFLTHASALSTKGRLAQADAIVVPMAQR